MLGRIRRLQQRHWRERSKAERVELQSMVTWHSSIWVLPLGWLLLPMIGGLAHRLAPVAIGGLLLAVTLLQCAAASRVLGPALDHYLARAELPARAMRGPAVLLGVALAAIVALATVDGIDAVTLRLAIGAVLMPFGLPYALTVPVRTFLRRAAVLAALIVAAFAAVRASGLGSFATLIVTAFATGFSLAAARCGAWTLSVLWEAERAREIEARLAVAEERLRFGRDLHDVLGRNLSVISLKSELAVQLARRGRPEAVEQMIEVQRIAQESQREVRDVIRGYREADLVVELAGAQGVLMAAGIDCEVRAEAARLPAEVQSALGWVVREAATNVLRHGDAGRCAVGLRMREERVVLTVENDGVAGTPHGGGGSGLPGLRERLAAVDGTLEAGLVGKDRFRLVAEVPLKQEASEVTS
ncbi:two-component system sensor histidine kinase DesK [Streptomyces griseochromogenes]|uniref:Histidine kinase n=1 Tax=Streptomyces griseochromogenes TaxID=68214 RepID=A0A1B1BBE6_9ACTN|nr:histidine kinase [Streptomyces griseochromogenes]ANP56052.1 histidine kinase [Streptomyces griseochromogenes]MBP2051096.1 two-component system sensor histidine kinase DesK [Streptomyces griseochromogenes]